MLLVPPYLVYVRARPPVHRVLQQVRQRGAARAARRAQGRTRHHGLHGRTVRDDRRVGIRRSAGPGGTHPADPGAADSHPGGGRRRDAACRNSRGAGGRERCGGRFRADGRRGRGGAGARPATPGFRSPASTAVHRLPAHQGRAEAGRRSADRDRSGAGAAVAAGARRRCRWPMRCRGCAATTATSPWSTADDGGVAAMVAMEDLVEDLVGRRDGALEAQERPKTGHARGHPYDLLRLRVPEERRRELAGAQRRCQEAIGGARAFAGVVRAEASRRGADLLLRVRANTLLRAAGR